jgi:IS4 transposase
LTEAGFPDVKSLEIVPIEAGAFYVMDRGYLDFRRLSRWQAEQAYFVVRCPRQVRFRVRESRAVDKSAGLRCDQIIRLKTYRAKRDYPHTLRRVKIYDAEHQLSLVLLTNHLALPAATISLLYRKRWQVELFFKWIKQHLKLRTFLGRSQNAVRCQVWAAICAYLLVVLAKKELGLPQTLHRILQTLSISPFEQIPLLELLAETISEKTEMTPSNQLTLNGL